MTTPLYEQPWFGIAVGLVAMVVGLTMLLVLRQRQRRRGFEVKLNAGTTPLNEKKDETTLG